MIFFVCGGRDYNDAGRVRAVLNAFIDERRVEPDFVLHGNARGADELAGDWAHEMGYQELKAPANWSYYGKRAGFKRNAAMLSLLTTNDQAFVFPGGKGTAMMRGMLERKGIPCKVVDELPDYLYAGTKGSSAIRGTGGFGSSGV